MSYTIEQESPNSNSPKEYLNQKKVEAATKDGTDDGTEFQFDQTTKNIEENNSEPSSDDEQLSNNEKIPERAQKRYTALL